MSNEPEPTPPQPESDEWFEALGDEIEKHPIAGAAKPTPPQPEPQRTPAEWSQETGVLVFDWGGWRDKSFDEPITKDEFFGRCHDSRCHWPRAVLDALIEHSQPEPQCTCDMRTKLVGDGCAVCNPEKAAQYREPQQSAAEWVETIDSPMFLGLRWIQKRHALELARRYDEAKSNLRNQPPTWAQCVGALYDSRAEATQLRAQLAAAQAEAARLREALEWYGNLVEMAHPDTAEAYQAKCTLYRDAGAVSRAALAKKEGH